MRLINTSTLELREFFDNEIPFYAILSHRWEEEEVTHKDVISGEGREKKGWAKITKCCERGALDGWDWVWIDSCCIDKSSSAELSEAINSMFRWYRDAEVCYAYLSDVPSAEHDLYEEGSKFRQSKWFTRGWTLQELIAPGNVEFYDADWSEIGTKRSLTVLLESITGINHLARHESASVAQKMSWASHRITTRLEDQAYCLMGLFDVNMPLLYGEGRKAFLRLQLEILSNLHDETIFAWEYPNRNERHASGLLAASPLAFQASGDVVIQTFDHDRQPPVMTAKGLRVEAYLLTEMERHVWLNSSMNHLAPLQCTRRSALRSTDWIRTTPRTFLAVGLRLETQTWRRTGALEDMTVPGDSAYDGALLPCFHTQPIVAYISQDPFRESLPLADKLISIKFSSLLEEGYIYHSVYSLDLMGNRITGIVSQHADNSSAGASRQRLVLDIWNVSGCILITFRKKCSDNSKPLILILGFEYCITSMELRETDESIKEIRVIRDRSRWSRSDRKSLKLEDGASINVSAKPSTTLLNQREGAKHVKCIEIDLALDKSGKLRWPSE